ncbi:MAG: hypothetical protein BGO21_26690 [Dyadobacter sp. 50-39]|uniref:hypothetical protein n=1 Tax=Dyadobacter sp. 50-39 TaxID=1895756 RepID=UPI000963332C|nr:hypothetical protein [Dyadobacter sp. 50-39]OJV16478.1 MAG: hypothetical protein BGO21_26690 [Dyadobacter sp. 50-39]
MTTIFWAAVLCEFAALMYYIRKFWLLTRENQSYVYPEQYRQVFYPMIVLALLIIVSLVCKYFFRSGTSATFVALLPLILLGVLLLMVIVTAILAGGKWN